MEVVAGFLALNDRLCIAVALTDSVAERDWLEDVGIEKFETVILKCC